MAPFTTVLLVCLLVVLQSYASVVDARARYTPRPVRNTTWPGWKGVKYLFSFGDSYTSTLFNVHGLQPNATNPIGNPSFPGSTSSYGENYIGFMTAKYNESLILSYNLAVGGATIDADLVEPFLPILDWRGQVDLEFVPLYCNRVSPPWTTSNSLFSIFIGINDVQNSYTWHNSTIISLLMAEYSKLVDELYQCGARNFLFINVPPIDRSPGTMDQGASFMHDEASDIAEYNAGVAKVSSNLTATYLDTTAFLFNANALFSTILGNPGAYPQTAGLKNLTGCCQAYATALAPYGDLTPTTFDPSCPYPVNDYFWLNNLHPVWPVHEAMAAQITKQLGA